MKLNLTPILENDTILIRPLENDDFTELFKIAKQPILWQYHPIQGYTYDVFKEFFNNAIKMGSLLIIDMTRPRIY